VRQTGIRAGLVKEIAPETFATGEAGWQENAISLMAGKLIARRTIEVVFKSAGNYTVILEGGKDEPKQVSSRQTDCTAADQSADNGC
jgi:hypothetical protein